MSDENKITGKLTFDINSGKFWITNAEDSTPLTDLNFGDTFEVLADDGKWVETSLQIDNGPEGDLVFKLKNTKYSGILDDLDVRK